MNLNRLDVLFQEAGDDGAAGGGAGAAGAGAASGEANASGKKPDGQAAGEAGKGGEGAGKAFTWGDGWREHLAAGDEKVMARLQRFNTPGDIFQSYRAMEQRMSSGELKSALPKDAKPEEVTKWRQENGIPEVPEKYDLKFDDGLVIGDDDKPVIGEFLKVAHAANLTNDQTKGAVKWYYDEIERQLAERQEQDKTAEKNAQDALRADWGNDYRGNINRVHALLDMAPTGVKDALLNGRMADGTPVGSHPDMLRFLSMVSRQLNPVGTVVPGAGANIGNAIEDEITAIEKTMREDRKTYNKDEKMQARYRELLSARERLGKQDQRASAMAR